MNHLKLALPALAAASLFFGCSAATSLNTCVAGASASCACTDGRTGAQVCNAGGAFDACVCASEGSGSFDAGTFTVSTVAGGGRSGDLDGTGGVNGTAEFRNPNGVAADSAGNLYVADYSNARIRKIDAAGVVTTLAGNGTPGFADGTGGRSGTAEFNGPFGVAVDSSGNVFVADSGNNRIRKIDPSGNVTTVAGDGTSGFLDGAAVSARFWAPFGVAVSATGVLYVADRANNKIRMIDSAGMVSTLSGTGALGDRDGTGGPNGTSEFAQPTGLAVDLTGHVYVADYSSHRIRKLDANGNTITLAGNGQSGFHDGSGGPAGDAQFGAPISVTIDASGNVYVADGGNNRLRMIAPDGSTTTVAGSGQPAFADGVGKRAEFSDPSAVAIGPTGLIFIADTGNNAIRQVIRAP
jgi:sugar lactone lactonase YvrE